MRGNRSLPRLYDFTFAQLSPFIGRGKLLRTAPIDNPRKWRYLLHGSRFWEQDGVDFTGYAVAEIPGISEEALDKICADYRTAALKRAPSLHRARLAIGGKTHDYFRLLLPYGSQVVEHLFMFALMQSNATITVTPLIRERMKRSAEREAQTLRRLLQPAIAALRA